MEEGDAKVHISIARKLHRTIDLLREHFEGLPFHAGAFRTIDDPSKQEPFRSLNEYGFLVSFQERDLLWVGMWAQEKLLLGAAYKTDPNRPSHCNGFSGAKSEEGKGWEVLILNDLFLKEGSDVVCEAITRLQPVLEKMTQIYP